MSPPLHLENCPKTGQWPWKGDGETNGETHPRWSGTMWHHLTDPTISPTAPGRHSTCARARINDLDSSAEFRKARIVLASTLTTVNYETSCDYQEIFSIAIPKVQLRLRASWWLSGLMLFIYVYFVGHINLDTRHDRFSNNSAMPHWNRGMQDVRNPPPKSWFVTIWRRENP